MVNTKQLHEIADFMEEYGFGIGDHCDAPTVRHAAAELDLLRGQLNALKGAKGEVMQLNGATSLELELVWVMGFIEALPAGDEATRAVVAVGDAVRELQRLRRLTHNDTAMAQLV